MLLVELKRSRPVTAESQLVRHEVAEERVVYAAVRVDVLPGDAVAAAVINKERDIDGLIVALEKLDSAEPAFESVLEGWQTEISSTYTTRRSASSCSTRPSKETCTGGSWATGTSAHQGSRNAPPSSSVRASTEHRGRRASRRADRANARCRLPCTGGDRMTAESA